MRQYYILMAPLHHPEEINDHFEVEVIFTSSKTFKSLNNSVIENGAFTLHSSAKWMSWFSQVSAAKRT